MSEAPAQPILVAGRWERSEAELESRAAGTGEVIGHTYNASAEQLDRATGAAVGAFATTRKLPTFERAAMLSKTSAAIRARRETLGRMLAREAGKPLPDALVEVDRTAFLFGHAAAEAERLNGELLPLDVIGSSRGKWAITRRMPIGPVAGISPFNLPLSLSAHKIAPALAVGNPIVLKPDSRTALTVLMLGEILMDAGVPEGALSILPMEIPVADAMVTDDRFKLLSFTGSARVGWDMKARAGRKQVVLELGGNAAVIVAEDADLDLVVKRGLIGAFKYAGQICISVQRMYVHRSLFPEVVERLVEATRRLRVGPPLETGVDIGPMISEHAAEQAVALVQEAVAKGASLLLGGERNGAYVEPMVLTDVPTSSRMAREEAFAPVVAIQAFDSLPEAIALVNDSDYGLQTGVFTRDIGNIWAAFEDLETGGVVINDVPTFRVDHMPYGGVKDSGIGREGVRYAIEHMTELRTLVLTPGSEQ